MTDGLLAGGTRAGLDDRDNYTPGWKYNHWELKEVSLCASSLARGTWRLVTASWCAATRAPRRLCDWCDLSARRKEMCEEMQADMLARATEKRNASVVT